MLVEMEKQTAQQMVDEAQRLAGVMVKRHEGAGLTRIYCLGRDAITLPCCEASERETVLGHVIAAIERLRRNPFGDCSLDYLDELQTAVIDWALEATQ